jgi:hypothetical protein
MTDRQRFENKALENNATILEATATMLKVEATNGLLTTTYQFDENGKFISASH